MPNPTQRKQNQWSYAVPSSLRRLAINQLSSCEKVPRAERKIVVREGQKRMVSGFCCNEEWEELRKEVARKLRWCGAEEEKWRTAFSFYGWNLLLVFFVTVETSSEDVDDGELGIPSWAVELKNVEMLRCWCVENALLSPENLNLIPLSVSDGFEKWWMLSTYPDSAETSCFVEKRAWWKEKRKEEEDEDGCWDVLMMESCRWSGKMVVAEMKKCLLMILMSKRCLLSILMSKNWLLRNLMSKKMLLENLLSREIVVCSLCDEVKWSREEEDV
jgi:hypothetical protein